jgi:hypothetical protein
MVTSDLSRAPRLLGGQVSRAAPWAALTTPTRDSVEVAGTPTPPHADTSKETAACLITCLMLVGVPLVVLGLLIWIASPQWQGLDSFGAWGPGVNASDFAETSFLDGYGI